VKKIAFTEQARTDVRRLDIPTAMRIFTGIHRFAETGIGDVKKLAGDTDELRLRIGPYRLRFVETMDTILVKRVLHRSEAYR
jgi:mRNA interferase RelE/StbE